MIAEARKSIPALVMILVIGGIYVARGWFSRFDELPYRGQTFKLAHSYWSMDGFSSDPQMEPSVLLAVQDAVSHGKLTPTYANRWDLIEGNTRLMFPGFGMTHFAEQSQPDGSVLAGVAIEVPLANKDRVIVYRGRGDTWTLIDDFLWSPEGAVFGVKDKDGKLEYSSFGGGFVVTREPSVPK